MPVDLSVAIVSYNVRELLAECLSSLEERGRPLRQEVIVVDNASKDGSAEMIQEKFPHVRLIRNGQNLGFARGTNQALRVSQGRHLLLLNPDSIVVGDCLPRMVEFMDTHPECGAAMSRVWLDRSREWSVSNHDLSTPLRIILSDTRIIGRTITPSSLLERYWRLRWELWLAEHPREVEFISGNFFLVRRSVFTQVGGLDDRFFMYYEDTDWSRRIVQAGWKLYFYPEGGVVHHVSQSSKGVSDMLSVAGRESQRYYLRKHFGWIGAASVRFLLAVDSYLFRVLRRLRGFGDDWPGPIGPGATLDLVDCPVRLSWPAVPEATRYLFEISLDRLFLGGTAARFVPGTEVELPREELQKTGFPRAYWRAVPICGDVPMASWLKARR